MNSLFRTLAWTLSMGWIAATASTTVAETPVAVEPGFVSLFDGETLKGWRGDERFWRVEGGAIVGETSEENSPSHNTFLIYDGESFGDFELRFSYQVTGFNSGMQYRSVEKDDFVVHGYQADFEAQWHDDGKADKFSGMFFEEGGRMFMGQRGDAVIVKNAAEGSDKPEITRVASTGDPAELESVIQRDGQWNDYVIVARGFQFTHIINGRVMSIGYDEDTEHRKESGILAIQLHEGPPMQIKVKDVRIRKLNP